MQQRIRDKLFFHKRDSGALIQCAVLMEHHRNQPVCKGLFEFCVFRRLTESYAQYIQAPYLPADLIQRYRSVRNWLNGLARFQVI